MQRPEVPLSRGDRRLGAASLLLFVLTFVPTPMQEVFIEVTAEQGQEPAPPAAGGGEEYSL